MTAGGAAEPRLLGSAEVRQIAGRLGIRPAKRLGQNFVVDPGTVRRIVTLVGLEPDDVVLEVGPGFGSLTLALLPAARRVIAVEVDPALAAELPRTVAERAPGLAGRLDVVIADAARVAELPGEPPGVLAANLPYNAAVPIVLHLLATVPSLARGLVMVQAEVADRMSAPPGSRIYGVPSVKLAWFAAVRRAGPVPRSVFWPVPQVDSGLVTLERREPPDAGASREEVFAVVDAAFAQRRKTLRAALAGWAGSAAAAEQVLAAAGVDPGARGEALGVADFARIAAEATGVRGTVTGITVRVPAKVNLQLTVGPAGSDGYHDLVTVFHAVSLFDEVSVTAADRDRVVVTGEGADSVPDGSDNLAVRAAETLAAALGRRQAVSIGIRKRIPVAGLAGGSADAAAALVACNELWRAGLSQQQLIQVAADVGSDVAFALVGGTAVGLGRGERLTPALTLGTYHWVLAFAIGGLSTADVYAACDRLRTARAQSAGARPGPADGSPLTLSTGLMAALRSGDPAAVGPLLSNDLQRAAVSLRPDLRRTLAAGQENGALGAMVSGSGPTCAFLAKDARHARDLAVWLTGAGVCRSVASVTGPVPGATIASRASLGGSP